MKNLTFHLPKNYGKIIIESEESKDYIDTEKSAEELKNILRENLPCGMYTELEEKIISEYLDRSCNISTLELLKKEISSSMGDYAKGFDLHRIVKRIITERGREE